MIIATYSTNPKFSGLVEPKFRKLYKELVALYADGSKKVVKVVDGKLYAVTG